MKTVNITNSYRTKSAISEDNLIKILQLMQPDYDCLDYDIKVIPSSISIY